MVSKDLLDYIKSVKGKYSYATIRQTLSAYGYTQQQINEALQEVNAQELVEYINTVRKKGQSDDTIKTNLERHGYTKKKIDQAFGRIFEQTPKVNLPQEKPAEPHETKPVKSIDLKPPSKSKLPVRLILAVILLTAIIGAVYIIMSKLDIGSISFGKSCEGVSINIYEIDKPLACVYPDNSKAQLGVENSGTVIISDLEIILKGDSEVTDNIENLHLTPGAVSTSLSDYDGSIIEEIIITPILKTEEIVRCDGNKITIKEFSTC